MTGRTCLLLFLVLGVVTRCVEAQHDCLCQGLAKGPQTVLATGSGMQLGVQVASNSLDGSFLALWNSESVVSSSDVQVSVQGKIVDSALQPISTEFTLLAPKTYTDRWAPWIAGAAFHPVRRWYFVLLVVPRKDASGSDYNVLRGYIVSANGTVLATDLQVSTNGPHTEIAFDRTGVLYNSVNHEFLVNYTVFIENGQRHVVQRFNAEGFKVAPYRIFPTAEYVRHDFRTNRYLLTDNTLFNGLSEIHSQVVDATLRLVGGPATVFSVPYDIQKNLRGPFPVYNSAQSRFLIFWSYGPGNNPVFHGRPVASNGQLLNEVRTSLHKPIQLIRYNPLTEGYLLLPNYSKVTHLSRDFVITREFIFPCDQVLPPGNPSVLFSRVKSEFLLTWFYPLRYGADIDAYARRLRAVVSQQPCSN